MDDGLGKLEDFLSETEPPTPTEVLEAHLLLAQPTGKARTLVTLLC